MSMMQAMEQIKGATGIQLCSEFKILKTAYKGTPEAPS
jgi:hypothetical protein